MTSFRKGSKVLIPVLLSLYVPRARWDVHSLVSSGKWAPPHFYHIFTHHVLRVVTHTAWEKCEMKFRLVSSNSRGLSLARAQGFCIRNWRYFKRGLFIYFVVDTWNVLPVVSENDKSAGLWKLKVRSCFVMCLLMVTTWDQSEIIDRSDMWTRNLKMPWKTIYWFLFVYWRHNCSRCCKWLMEFYVNKLILDQILADLIQ